MDTVDQVHLRYDPVERAFRPVALTLAADDQAVLSSRFIALADALYRPGDVSAGPTLCFAQIPDDPHRRNMVIRRVPDTGSGRLAAAAHVLISPELIAGAALGLADWPDWFQPGPDGQLAPLPWLELKRIAADRYNRLKDEARKPGLEAGLTRLVDALLRADAGRLAVVGHQADPVLLLTGAREVLGNNLTEDWTFSTGEQAQKPGIRVTFMLPGNAITSATYADLSKDDDASEYRGPAANLVRAFIAAPDLLSWQESRREARVQDRASLLAWARAGAPGSETYRIVRAETERLRAESAARRNELEAELRGAHARREEAEDELAAERAKNVETEAVVSDLRAAGAETQRQWERTERHRAALDSSLEQARARVEQLELRLRERATAEQGPRGGAALGTDLVNDLQLRPGPLPVPPPGVDPGVWWWLAIVVALFLALVVLATVGDTL
ncbi:hypothetical protein [Frankia sp. AgB32]|uniref:hypothetical protein n=1 Tax=Frankia sp. AgB32 TaxID=631119 RepID=UPI00200F0878|nr:hypothetical protein [Frankia sp. AgB32]MCK9896905.1 hypothetical protein [Frankia sp. AgB32]